MNENRTTTLLSTISNDSRIDRAIKDFKISNNNKNNDEERIITGNLVNNTPNRLNKADEFEENLQKLDEFELSTRKRDKKNEALLQKGGHQDLKLRWEGYKIPKITKVEGVNIGKEIQRAESYCCKVESKGSVCRHRPDGRKKS